MASVKILGGDFVVGRSGSFTFGELTLPTPEHPFLGEKIPLRKVMRVEAVNKEMNHRTGAAVGRGLIGAIVAGPVGALVGFATTNHKSDVTFEAEFEGGRRLLATANTATYTKLLAAAFDYKPPPVIEHEAEERAAADRADVLVRRYQERKLEPTSILETSPSRSTPTPLPLTRTFGKRA